MSIESDVLKKIKPTAEETESILNRAESLKKEILKYVSVHKLDINVKFVGSVAKGTFLADPDLDVFLMFPLYVSREELEKIGLKAGEDILHGEQMYAEHPYIRGIYKNLDVDMVPCYNIASTENLLTSVDRTPFHTDYILSRTDEHMKDEIRLMKKFMKGIGTYGAEPNTRGFSGYMCELITLHYGGFIDAIIAAAEWREGITIVIEKRGPPMVAPIVLYDPVDPRRNVASAVHIDTLAEFITACKSYIRMPDEKFFFPKDRISFDKETLIKKTELHGTRLVTVKFTRPEVNEDNLHSQLWKTQYALSAKLDAFSFNVLRAVHKMTNKEVVIVFEIERDMLSKTYKHIGPPIWVKTSVAFHEKWKNNEFGEPFIENGHWTVIAERMYFTAAEMLTDEAAIAGIGREIKPTTMKIMDHDATLNDTDSELLTELLDPKHSWEV